MDRRVGPHRGGVLLPDVIGRPVAGRLQHVHGLRFPGVAVGHPQIHRGHGLDRVAREDENTAARAERLERAAGDAKEFPVAVGFESAGHAEPDGEDLIVPTDVRSDFLREEMPLEGGEIGEAGVHGGLLQDLDKGAESGGAGFGGLKLFARSEPAHLAPDHFGQRGLRADFHGRRGRISRFAGGGGVGGFQISVFGHGFLE